LPWVTKHKIGWQPNLLFIRVEAANVVDGGVACLFVTDEVSIVQTSCVIVQGRNVGYMSYE
jgi:hypothetical protein